MLNSIEKIPSSKTKERDSRNAQSNSNRMISRITLILLIGILFLIPIFFPLFHVKRWVWHGTQLFQPTSVEDRLQTFLQNTPTLWHLSLEPLVHALAKYPVIEHVAIRKRWPDTLDIYIRERRPYLVVHDGQGLKILDRHGVFFSYLQGFIQKPELQPLVKVDSTIMESWSDIWKIQPVIDALREEHDPWLEAIPWIEVTQDLIIIRMEEPYLRILLADHNDYTPSGEWPEKARKRLNFLQMRWETILDKLGNRYNELDLRFKDQIILR